MVARGSFTQAVQAAFLLLGNRRAVVVGDVSVGAAAHRSGWDVQLGVESERAA